MLGWKTVKQAFDAWEQTTARHLEDVLRNPAVLAPSGKWLSLVMKAKAAGEQAASTWWGALGLPTKRDQERTLHALHRLESRLLDLEEHLEERPWTSPRSSS